MKVGARRKRLIVSGRALYPCVVPARHIGQRHHERLLKPLTINEFLAWERVQDLRDEFDGIQPVAVTGGTFAHARTITRLTNALGNRPARRSVRK